MFAAGLISEVRSLILSPRPLSQTARQALGYKEVLDWLKTLPNSVLAAPNAASAKNGRVAVIASQETRSPPRELVELIQTRTRQFAKRQHTWFRNLEECVPIETGTDDNVAALVDRIVDQGLRSENL